MYRGRPFAGGYYADKTPVEIRQAIRCLESVAYVTRRRSATVFRIRLENAGVPPEATLVASAGAAIQKRGAWLPG